MKLTKAEINTIRSLNKKKERNELGLFVVEGEKMVAEALASSFQVEAVYREEDIGKEAMERISLLSSPSPVLAVVKIPTTNDSISTEGLSLALDCVRDPGNMGTIIRIADWLGIERIFLSKDCVDIYNPKTIQATMGAIFRKKITYIDLESLVSTYLDKKLPVYGTFLDGENIYKKTIKNRDKGLIIMGSENNGISKEIESLIDNKLYIPPFPAEAITSESLNVAIATAIICAEFRREE